jgi:hypothetical protein
MLAVALPLVALPLLGRARRPRAYDLALAGVAFLLVVGPVLAFSWLRASRTGVFRVGSPADVYNFYLGNNPRATGRAESLPEIPQPGTSEAPDMEAVARLVGPRAIAYALTHPLHEALLFLQRASFNFAPNKRDVIYLYGQGLAGERSPYALQALYSWVAIGMPLVGAVLLLAIFRQPHDSALRFALLLALVGILPYQCSIGDARYLIPFHPLLVFAASALLSPHRSGRWSAWARLAIGFFAIAFFLNAAYDVRATDIALRAITRVGGSTIHPPYILAR